MVKHIFKKMKGRKKKGKRKKTIELESDQASRFNYQFTEDVETC